MIFAEPVVINDATCTLVFEERSVVTCDVISVEEVDFSGHVYNLQTGSGCYSANAIVAHNCTCSIVIGREDI